MQNNNTKQKNEVKYRAYAFSLEVIKLIKDFPNDKIYSILSNQLLRSATSIGANIIEGGSGSSKKDFTRYYEIALKSANESKYWLAILRDGLNADKKKVESLLQELDEISRILAASLLILKNKR